MHSSESGLRRRKVSDLLPTFPFNGAQAMSDAEVHLLMCFSFLVASIVSALILVNIHLSSPPHFTPVAPLAHSFLDNREYKFGELKNGLKFVVVRDPLASKAGFALKVSAGSFDAPEIMGLPHLLEHVVFRGSSRFPDGWDHFVGKYGGMSNAFTADDETVYYAQLAFDGFGEGLERFASFVVDPRLTIADAEKEVSAVDSEHARNKLLPDRRLDRVARLIQDPSGFTGRFMTGNVETLKTDPERAGIAIDVALRKFFDDYYCPSRITLAVYHRDPPETIYWDLANALELLDQRACTDRFTAPHELRTGQVARLFAEKTPGRRMEVRWSLPFSLKKLYKVEPSPYLEYMFEYESNTAGLRSWLNSRALILDCDFSTFTTDTDTLLRLNLLLLPDTNYEEVLDLIDKYIEHMLHHGVDTPVLESIQRRSLFSWQWNAEQDGPASLAAAWAERLSFVPPQDFTTCAIPQMDPNWIKKVLSLITRANSNVILTEPRQGGQLMYEKYYGIDFSVNPLPPYKVPHLSTAELEFPAALPAPPQVLWTVAELTCPRHEHGGVLGVSPSVVAPLFYHRFGSIFGSPTYVARFRLVSVARMNPQDTMATRVFLRAVNMHMNIFNQNTLGRGGTSEATVSLLHLRGFGLELTLSGIFHEDNQALLDTLCRLLQHPTMWWTEALFKRAREAVKLTLANYRMSAVDIFRPFHYEDTYTHAELEAHLPATSDAPREVIQRLLGVSRLDGIAIGGISKEVAEKLRAIVQSHFKVDATAPTPHLRRVRQTPLHLVLPHPQPGSIMHSGLSLYELSPPLTPVFGMDTRAQLLILDEIVRPESFLSLRSNAPHPPYVATAGAVMARPNLIQIHALVEDHRMSAADIEANVKNFLTVTMRARLASVTEDELDTLKYATMEHFKNPPKSVAEEQGFFLDAAADEYTCKTGDKFQLPLLLLRALAVVSKADLVALWETVVQERAYSSLKVYASTRPIEKKHEQDEADVRAETARSQVRYHPDPVASLDCSIPGTEAPKTFRANHSKSKNVQQVALNLDPDA